jgi:hypothetical protein
MQIKNNLNFNTMKKVVLILMLLQSICIISQEKKTYLSIQENNIYGSWDKSWGCDIFDVEVIYSWRMLGNFSIGAGSGLGLCNPVKYFGLISDSEKRETTIEMPIFIRIKKDFGTNQTRLFISLDVGKRLCLVEGYNGDNFNPFTYNITPSFGCDIQLNKVNTLNIGAGFELDHSKYQFIGNHTYTLKSDGAWAGYLVYIGLSF